MPNKKTKESNPPVYMDDEFSPPDAPVSLDYLAINIPKWQKKYGKKAVLYFDAGANNVSVVIHPSKKVK